MGEFLKQLIVVCPLVFLAGFVDSVAGGGGLISLPAYLMVGLPAHLAVGTNKCVALCGTLVSSASYLRSGRVVLRIAVPTALCALIASTLCTRFAVALPDAVLKTLLLAALPCVAVFLAVKKDFGREGAAPSGDTPGRRELILVHCIGLLMGAYDGLIGPGTGTFLIMLFTALLGLDLLTASGCAKLANLASNLASAVVWAVNGAVLWRLVLPAALCNMLGNFCGARFAIRGGSGRVRALIFVVLALLLLKTLRDLLVA